MIFAACAAPSSEGPNPADEITLIVNADIVTVDDARPSAQAMAIRGDRIVAIGSESEVRKAIPGYQRFFDLEGRTVVPGFIESHDHLFMSSGASLVTDVAPFTTPRLADALAKLTNVKPDKDGWVVAFGADQTLYEERRGPTRDVLDPLFPDTPVIVFHLSGHAAFMNGAALRLSGLDESTPEPRGGFFEKKWAEPGSITIPWLRASRARMSVSRLFYRDRRRTCVRYAILMNWLETPISSKS